MKILFIKLQMLRQYRLSYYNYHYLQSKFQIFINFHFHIKIMFQLNYKHFFLYSIILYDIYNKIEFLLLCMDFLSITRELSTMIKYTEMNTELIFALINSYGITKTTC